MTDVVTIILSVIAIVALIGNTLTVILFLRKLNWLKKAHSCLILALSIQDILLGISVLVLPSFVQNEHVYPLPSDPKARSLFCSLVWSHYIPFALGVTSVYTCLMLTIDRWFAVVRPMSYRRYEKSAKVISAMVTVPWITGFCFEITSPLYAVPVERNGSSVCAWSKVGNTNRAIAIAVFSLLGMIVIPAFLMIVAYAHIILRLRRSRTRVSSSVAAIHGDYGNAAGFMTLKRVTKTAFIASAIVIICWLPDQLYYALSQVGLASLGTSAHSVVKILAFANSCLNPFIYSFSNSTYRKGFKEIICLLCVKKVSNTEYSQE